jgi:AraC-like DNA-binding protein
MHEGYAVTEHSGRQHGVEVLLGPLAARRLLGVPMDQVANQVAPLDALRGRAIDELADRLRDAPTWDRRFDLLDATLSRWIDDAPEPDRAVDWAWRQLKRSRGNVAVGALAEEIGWSRRHFASRFRSSVGLQPKSAARVLRFDHAVGLLLGGRHATVADVAATAGYADHSHLAREFRALAGCTPTEFVAARMPDEGGISA